MVSADLPNSTPGWLLALGTDRLPTAIEVGGQGYSLVRPFKHDFFAATGLYQGPAGQVVLKVGRLAPILGVSMAWIGRLLARHEIRLMKMAEPLGGVPRFVGTWGATGLVHDYIEGRPLRRDDRPGDDFFPELSKLIERMHEMEIAYVDLEKPENILIGDNGRPYLFDFQISWHLPAARMGHSGPARRIREALQAADRYHLLKHWRKLRPDQLSREVLEDRRNIPFWIRGHRLLFRPITLARRQFLVWLGVRDSIKVRSPG